MKILVTGAKGFIGKNLVLNLKTCGYDEIYEYDIGVSDEEFETYCKNADFVYNLAGVNRPKDPEEFMKGNFGFASKLLDTLKKYGNKCPVMLSSSVQAQLDNDYGKSKKAGEDLFFSYGKDNGVKVYVYRFPNVFGKWCRPNYNSAVATFCNNIANGLPITVNGRETELTLVYIDDVVKELISCLKDAPNFTENGFCAVKVTHKVTLGQIVDLLYSFKESRNNKLVPDLGDPFTAKLYATYLSYLPKDGFSYPLDMKSDERGSFTEIVKTLRFGQVSVNIAKPHIVKGNHWHNTKNEKFVVVSGKGIIRFRNPLSEEIIEYHVSGEKIEVVDIPVGYTHNIENVGDTDLVTVMWASELFDPENPDTFFLKV